MGDGSFRRLVYLGFGLGGRALILELVRTTATVGERRLPGAPLASDPGLGGRAESAGTKQQAALCVNSRPSCAIRPRSFAFKEARWLTRSGHEMPQGTYKIIRPSGADLFTLVPENRWPYWASTTYLATILRLAGPLRTLRLGLPAPSGTTLPNSAIQLIHAQFCVENPWRPSDCSSTISRNARAVSRLKVSRSLRERSTAGPVSVLLTSTM